MSEHVNVSKQNNILHIQLNRPERKNALSLAMYQCLADSIATAGDDEDVRVILLSGAGGCFTSGNDLQDFMQHRGELGEKSQTPQFMQALLFCDKPVVAAVEGPAVGIGTTMLLHCDLVYAGESAFLQMPFTKLALCPEFASSLLVPRLAGHQRAAELLLFGEAISAARGRELGIVNDVYGDGEELMRKVLEKCAQLAKLPASSLRATKQLMKQSIRAEAPAVMKHENELFARGLKSPEFAEAVAAFTEKREANFYRL